jgi:hypothetical protein
VVQRGGFAVALAGGGVQRGQLPSRPMTTPEILRAILDRIREIDSAHQGSPLPPAEGEEFDALADAYGLLRAVAEPQQVPE